MKKLLVIPLLFALLATFGQNTPLSFSQIPYSATDIRGHNRGAQECCALGWWDNVHNIEIPNGTSHGIDYEYRFLWQQVEGNTAGSYTWTLFDQQIQNAINNGQKFAFGIMPECSACAQNPGWTGTGGQPGLLTYPIYLHTQMQGESPTDYLDNENFWVINWNSPSYITAWRNLYAAVMNHIMTTSYNGVPYYKVISKVDVRGYGDFGEWHDYPYYNETGYASRKPTAATLDTLINIAGNTFYKWPCLIGIAAFDGDGATFMPASATYYALTYKNAWGLLGWNRDDMGNSGSDYMLVNNSWSYNPGDSVHNFKYLIMARYLYAPIGGEPLNGSQPYGDMSREISLYGYSFFRNYNYGSYVTDPTTIANLTAASKQMGYRLTVDTGYYTTSPIAGGSFTTSLNWKNSGVAPIYGRYYINFQLRTGGGTVVWQDSSYFNLKGFLNGGVDSTVTDTKLLTGVSAGIYGLYMVVTDSLGYESPVPLAISGRNADGSYLLASSVVVAPNSGPVANAGSNQTITLPTNSVTLNGSGSSGTITSYLWTQVSGPNTPTIVTPTGVTTVVNGLIQGIYVFQLAVNAGVSTATVQITVNPAPPVFANIFTTQTPAGGTLNDGQGLETGVRFQSSIAGWITGVRFYKTSGNTGTHVGELYTNTGTLLATGVYSGETATGWQSLTFTTPVAILANTTYVATYYSAAGYYVATNNGFATAIVNGNLTGLADASPTTPNGVYIYTATTAFPTAYYQASNYWVDVIFSTTNPGAPQNFDVPLVSGCPTITSMTGHNPLDTANILAGTYNCGSFSNLKGIYVRNKTNGVVTFTGQVSMFADSGMTFTGTAGGNWITFNGNGVNTSMINNNTGTAGQGWYQVTLQYLKFTNDTATKSIDQSGGMAWNHGVLNTYHWEQVTIHDIIEHNSRGLIKGSTGTLGQGAGHPPDVDDSLVFYNWLVDSTYSSGTNTFEGNEFTGISFRNNFHDIKVTLNSQRPPSGDIGLFTINGGNGVFTRIYKNGGPGYLLKIWNNSEAGNARDTYITFCEKVNSTGFGLVDTHIDTNYIKTGISTGNAIHIWNNSLINAKECCGYWSPLVKINYTNSFDVEIKNNFAVNNQTNGKPQIAYDTSGGSWNHDTSKNVAAAYATSLALDSASAMVQNTQGSFSTYAPTVKSVYLLNAGVTNPYATKDILNAIIRTPPDIGPIQLPNYPPPCICSPFIKYTKKVP